MKINAPILYAALAGTLISGCSTKESLTAGEKDLSQYLTEDNPYKDVAVVDKFGTWPEKSGEPYFSSQDLPEQRRELDYHYTQYVEPYPDVY